MFIHFFFYIFYSVKLVYSRFYLHAQQQKPTKISPVFDMRSTWPEQMLKIGHHGDLHNQINNKRRWIFFCTCVGHFLFMIWLDNKSKTFSLWYLAIKQMLLGCVGFDDFITSFLLQSQTRASACRMNNGEI